MPEEKHGTKFFKFNSAFSGLALNYALSMDLYG
jgi:hypothetical protein